jgi:hypothetical protein
MKKILIFSTLLLTITNYSFAQQYAFREPMSGVKSLFSSQPPIGGEESPVNNGNDTCVTEDGGLFGVYQPINADGEEFLAFILDDQGYSYRSPAFVIGSPSYPNIEIVDDESVFKRGELLSTEETNGLNFTTYELSICGTPENEEPVDTTPPPIETSGCTIDHNGAFGIYETLNADGEAFLAFILEEEGYSYRDPALFIESPTYPGISIIDDETVFRRGNLESTQTNNGLSFSVYELYFCGM